MARCEDFPCCGHTSGDPCPDRDRDGNVVPRCCICDSKLKKGAHSSICAGCQRTESRREDEGYIDPADY